MHGLIAYDVIGELEVVLDRRLLQDDWRGLNEGVMDNVRVISDFAFTVESRDDVRELNYN